MGKIRHIEDAGCRKSTDRISNIIFFCSNQESHLFCEACRRVWAEPPLYVLYSIMRIAHYFGPGAGKSKNTVYSLLVEAGHSVSSFYPNDFQSPKYLTNFDILIVSGGAAKTQANAIGAKGISAIRSAVDSGLGFIGICAGAYLATNHYSWSSGLVDAKVTDRQHWARGKGDCKILLSEAGQNLFEAESDSITIRYAQGPLLTRPEWPSPALPSYESLSIYRSDFSENGAPQGIMPGTTAILRSSFGKGRIGLFSPHPESNTSTQPFLLRMATWCNQRGSTG